MTKNSHIENASTARGRRNEALPNGVASDGELIDLVRAGGTAAYEQLYRRHVSAASFVARKHVDNVIDADDVVSEAFASVLQSLLAGKGPDTFFRAYLLCAVNRISHQKNKAWTKTQPTDDLIILDQEVLDVDPVLQSFESNTIVTAFKALPERWQAALWYVDIEGMKPAAAAPYLGLSPNAVSSLVGRAREGLSQNYLQNHIAQAGNPDCAQHSGQLGAYLRNGLNRTASKRIDAHLETCAECAAVLADLRDVQSRLRADLFPLFAGVAFSVSAAKAKGAAVIWTSRWPAMKRQLQRQISTPGIAVTGITASIAIVAAAAIATQGFGAWSLEAAQEIPVAAHSVGPTAPTTPATPAAVSSASSPALPSTSPDFSTPAPASSPSVPSPAPISAPSSPSSPKAPSSSPSASSSVSSAPPSVPGTSPSSPPTASSPAPSPRGIDTTGTASFVVGVSSGRCLTVAGPAGIQLVIADCANSGGTQNWSYDFATQAVSATVAGATYCLDAEGSGTSNGTRVIAWPCTGQPNQRWRMDSSNQTIVEVPSGRCMTVSGAATTNNSTVELWDCTTNSSNQQWMVTPTNG